MISVAFPSSLWTAIPYNKLTDCAITWWIYLKSKCPKHESGKIDGFCHGWDEVEKRARLF